MMKQTSKRWHGHLVCSLLTQEKSINWEGIIIVHREKHKAACKVTENIDAITSDTKQILISDKSEWLREAYKCLKN